ncbi:MAG: NAD(P)-binding domain-containing protein, partial [Muribaculaceae bacterium]|nr:NAD(P)-binding domain-containing protein [Muribaculaceae bacterium]
MLGSGNVAGHLAIGLDHIADVIQVYSPNIQHASSLADKLKKAQAVDNTDEIVTDADFYIIAVKDDAISSLAAKVTANGGIWAHTSGSVPMSVFEGVKDKYGVFYPLQTFNRHDSIDFSTLPMLIEGGDEETETALFNLASMISKDVHRATSGDRAVFH